jgi:addiction module RelE/StbE family toxin
MGYNIEYLPEAESDIDTILDYLSQFYRDTARKFFTALQRRIGQLADNPHMAEQWVDEPDFRKLLVGDYLVFYMVHDDIRVVEIHRVLRASWNIKPR